MEVYVDDMLVKSRDEADHLDNLKETFDTLCKYKLKPNPTKCVFFFFLLEANPDKIMAIIIRFHGVSTEHRGKS